MSGTTTSVESRGISAQSLIVTIALDLPACQLLDRLHDVRDKVGRVDVAHLARVRNFRSR